MNNVLSAYLPLNYEGETVACRVAFKLAEQGDEAHLNNFAKTQGSQTAAIYGLAKAGYEEKVTAWSKRSPDLKPFAIKGYIKGGYHELALALYRSEPKSLFAPYIEMLAQTGDSDKLACVIKYKPIEAFLAPLIVGAVKGGHEAILNDYLFPTLNNSYWRHAISTAAEVGNEALLDSLLQQRIGLSLDALLIADKDEVLPKRDSLRLIGKAAFNGGHYSLAGKCCDSAFELATFMLVVGEIGEDGSRCDPICATHLIYFLHNEELTEQALTWIEKNSDCVFNEDEKVRIRRIQAKMRAGDTVFQACCDEVAAGVDCPATIDAATLTEMVLSQLGEGPDACSALGAC